MCGFPRCLGQWPVPLSACSVSLSLETEARALISPGQTSSQGSLPALPPWGPTQVNRAIHAWGLSRGPEPSPGGFQKDSAERGKSYFSQEVRGSITAPTSVDGGDPAWG